MPRTHPPYAAEYRRRIVELARGGRSITALAREFEPTVENPEPPNADRYTRDSGDGVDDVGTATRVKDLGAVDYIVKPVLRRKFVSAIRAQLRPRRRQFGS